MTKQPFTVITAINKHQRMTDEEVEYHIVPFLTNRAFSLAPDAIFDAALLNAHPNMDPVAMYHYYINSLPKKSRFSPWPKKANTEGLDVIKQYFNIGSKKAIQIASIFSSDQINEMRQQLEVGGKYEPRNDKVSGD